MKRLLVLTCLLCFVLPVSAEWRDLSELTGEKTAPPSGGTDVTVSGNAITVSGAGIYRITGCGGGSVNTINGTADGLQYIIYWDNVGGTCTITHGTGNLTLARAQNITMNDAGDYFVINRKGATLHGYQVGTGNKLSIGDWLVAAKLNRYWEDVAISASAVTLPGDGKFRLTNCAGGNLDTISGTGDGRIVVLIHDGVGGSCTIRDNVGNIQLFDDEDVVMLDDQDPVMLLGIGSSFVGGRLFGGTGGGGGTVSLKTAYSNGRFIDDLVSQVTATVLCGSSAMNDCSDAPGVRWYDDTAGFRQQFFASPNFADVSRYLLGAVNKNVGLYDEEGDRIILDCDPDAVATGNGTCVFNDAVRLDSQTFSALGTPANGTTVYCSDCTKATPCAGSGSGAFAKRINGAWDCD